MSNEVVVSLDKFIPRSYQDPLFDAIENHGYKRVVCVLPRRAGKDLCAIMLALRYALRNVCVVQYIFPTYAQGKKVFFDNISNEGVRITDYIPQELILSINRMEMKITLVNHSIIMVVGSDKIDRLMGTNASFMIFSEYSMQSPDAYAFLAPVLAGNGGTAIFISTPRGMNHFYQMYQMALNSPEWFPYYLTLDDTKHITPEEIQKIRDENTMSEELIQQEFFCSWSRGIEGSYYGKYIDRLRLNGQIGLVPWDPSYKVHTSWDIGYRDSTFIIYYQIINNNIFIIRDYEKTKEGLEHYVNVVNSHNYTLGKHCGPHDIAAHEWGSGLTRIEKARRLGINFIVAPKVSIEDGIEAVRSVLPKMYIDEKNCARLIKALENYRQEWDDQHQVYKKAPLHDQWSHGADCMRYLCLSLSKIRDGSSAADLDKRYNEAVYGGHSNLPGVFR